MEKAKTLEHMLDEQISGFDKRRKRDKDKAFLFRMVQAFASASTTVLLGLNLSQLGWTDAAAQEWLKAAALIISAGATLFAAWDAFFDHRELWIRYATATSTLRGLRSELQYITSAGSASEAAIDRLFGQFQETLEKVNTSWQQLRASSSVARPQSTADPKEEA